MSDNELNFLNGIHGNLVEIKDFDKPLNLIYMTKIAISYNP